MKNIKRNSLLIILILFITLYFVLKDDFKNVVDTLAKVNLWWIVIGMLCMVVTWVFKTFALHILVKEQYKSIKFTEIFHQIVITEFFNGITPFSTGGQPMQVYMLNKKRVSVANATNIIVQSFIFFQTALLIHGIMAVILNYKFHLLEVNSTLWTLIMLGFLINTIVGVGLLFISFSTKFNHKLGHLIIRIGTRFKLIKNKEEMVEKWQEKLAEYHTNAEILRKKKSIFIKGVLYNFIALLGLYIIPIFVIFSMNDFTSMNIIEAVVASSFVLIIGNFVPIPGGSGGIEYGFLNFFIPFFGGSSLNAALIIWRFITYYFGILVGGVALSFFKGGVKECE